jgi:glycosyltransferase involved in cell wall biosynthesis
MQGALTRTVLPIGWLPAFMADRAKEGPVRLDIRPGGGDRTRVLVMEPHGGGHHATYLRWIVNAIVARGWTAVVALTARTLANPLLSIWSMSVARVEIRIIPVCPPDAEAMGRLGQLARQLRYWLLFRRLIHAEAACVPLSAVIVPYIDYCFFACALLGAPAGRLPWTAISMRLRVSEGTGAFTPIPWRWRCARRLLASGSLRALFAINPSVKEVPAGWLSGEARAKLHYLPDPAEPIPAIDRGASRRQLKLPEQGLVILVFGAINERKGVFELVRALLSDATLDSYTVVVAGVQSDPVRQWILNGPGSQLRERGRLCVIDAVLTDAEEAFLFSAADVVWLGYIDHQFMSGVMVQAARSGLPVVACNRGEMGQLVTRHQLGMAVDPARIPEVQAALRALTKESLRREIGNRARSVFTRNTPGNLQDVILDSLAL